MTDLIRLVQWHHQQILDLVDALAGEPGEAPPPAERRARAEQLVREASRHEAAEEQHLWPIVRRVVQSGSELAGTGVDQETTAKHLLHDLRHISPGTVEFDTLVRQVRSEIRTHVTFEESVILPSLRRGARPGDLERLGAAYGKAYRTGPTRPHPHTPPRPGVLKAAAPAMAALDRALDTITRRGR
jgi:hypothetical protein